VVNENDLLCTWANPTDESVLRWKIPSSFSFGPAVGGINVREHTTTGLIQETVVSHGAIKTLKAEYRAYLRQFITIDEQALNAEARKVKDSRKLEAMIPGIKGRDEDSI